jgi:hypothetical protein
MTKLTPAERDLLERIKEKEELRPFFFRKAKGLKWFSPLEESGYFMPKQNPRPVPSKEEGYVNVPFWPAAEYLVSTSPELLSVENREYAEKFIDVIRDVTKYAIDNNYSNYRTWWHFSKIIQNIHPDLVRVEDIVYVDYWLIDPYDRGLTAEVIGEKWLNALLDNGDAHCKLLSVKLLDSIYTLEVHKLKPGSGARRELMLRFNSWHAKKINKKVAGKAGKVLGADAVQLFQSRLETILNKENNDKWSFIWRSAIEDHDQNHGADDSEDIIIEAFRDSLLAYVEADPDSCIKYIEELLGSNFETIRRVAIYAIDRQFRYLCSCADHVISREYFSSNYRHELWQLLRNHYRDLGPEQKRCVLSIVNDLTETEESGQISEGATAYTRAIWFSAIKDCDEEVAKYYRQNIEKTGAEPKNPDFSSYMSVGNVEYKSPMPVEELLSLEIDDLLVQLSSVKDQGSFREPSFKGLVKALQQAVKAEPLRYYTLLHKFTEADLPFVNSIIEAYQELWTEKAQLPWDEIWDSLLRFCRDIVNQDRFWSAENAKERSSFVANRYWVVGAIGRLIESGTKSDEHAFNEKLLNNAEAVLLVLLDKETGAEFKVDTDAVSLAINSARGRCIEALVNMTLRSCRLSDKRSGTHVETWNHFQPIYDAELSRAEISEYEFVTLVSNYLPNFMYMSNDWVLENLDRIFDQNNYQKWLCAMQGYSFVSLVYEGIYKHLKEHGHLIKGLDDDNIKERVIEKVIQNIAVAYVNNFETLDQGLIKQLLQRGKQSELSHLIWFFWTLRKDGDDNIKAKVFALWPLILEVIDTSNREGRLLASKLCDWAAFVDEVTDENKELLLAVALFAEEGYNSYDLLRSISRISERQPMEACEIWLRLLEGAKPDFPEESIREALTNFIRIGHDGQRMAKTIVSEYLKGGNEKPSLWLREISLRNDE